MADELAPGSFDALAHASQIPLGRISRTILQVLSGDRETAAATFEEFRQLPRDLPVGARWGSSRVRSN